MGRWNTLVDPKTGRTIKSGLNVRTRGATPRTAPMGDIYRAVVLKTYATDSLVRLEGAPSTTRVYEIECDIVLSRSLVAYHRVPVMQPSHGVHDASLWIPRPSTKLVDSPLPATGPLGGMNLRRVSSRGTPQTMPPKLSELDGDQVLVQFVEGDHEKPIIVGAMSHARTKRLVVDGDGWSETNPLAQGRGVPGLRERYRRFAGSEFRVNAQGDVLFDTTGANPIDETTEVPNPASGGQVRFRLKDSERFTVEMAGVDVLEVWKNPITGQVHIDLGEGAQQSIVRGEILTSWLLAHTHPDAMGGTLPPIDPAGAPPVSLAAGDHLSPDHKVK